MAEVRPNPKPSGPEPAARELGNRQPLTRAVSRGASPPASGLSDTATNGWKPRYNPWAIAITVTLATFMEILDTSIANVALPHIAGALSSSVDESTWILTSYLVSNAIVLPMSAWLSTMVGRKRFYMSCVALFTLSSFMCGLAATLSTLIFFRVLQGAGGGGLQPSEQSILADTFAPEQRGMAFAVYGMAVVLAPAIGPTLGGWITDNYHWRWVFFINIPVGIVSLLLSQRVVEDPPRLTREKQAARRRGMRIDFIGLALLALTFGPLQAVLDKGEEDNWCQSHFVVTFAAIAAAALVIGIVWELLQRDPIVDLRLFKNRSFAVSALMMFALGFALYGTTVLLPEFVQELMGYTAQEAGMMLSPGGLVIMAMMPPVGVLLTWIDARWLIAWGFLIIAAALYHMTGINLEMSWGHAMMLRVYQSVGLAFLFVPINTVSYAGVQPEKNNQVSGLINLMRNVGGSVGISLSGAMIVERAQFHQHQLVQNVTAYDPQMHSMLHTLSRTLQPAGLSSVDATNQAYERIYASLQAQAQTLAYIDTFWVMAMAAVCLVPLVFLLTRLQPGKAPAGAH